MESKKRRVARVKKRGNGMTYVRRQERDKGGSTGYETLQSRWGKFSKIGG